MRCIFFGTRLLSVAALALFILASCRSNSGIATPVVPPIGDTERGQGALQVLAHKSKIKHVIIIVQENRSFNNLFYDYPGAKTKSYGYDSHGKKIPLKPISLKTKWDMQHNGQGFIASCNDA